MILHNNSHNMCFISNTIPIIIPSKLHNHVSLIYHQYYSILQINNIVKLNNSPSLSQVCLCSIWYSCFFNHDPYIKANHKNMGTMYTSTPCLSHLLHSKPMNAHNHIRFTIILQKPLNPICFESYWPSPGSIIIV